MSEMTVQKRLMMTADEFENFVEMPESRDKRLELIGGEVIDSMTNNYASMIAASVVAEIGMYVKGKNLGHLTGADGGYKIFDDRYVPNAAYISKKRQPEPSYELYNSNAPDLAIEVIPLTDVTINLADKVVNYLAAGTVVWVIYPDDQQAKIYEPGQPFKTVTKKGSLDGGDILPGFKLALKELFTT
jgi:Uma2 family endonuclease